jgi:hypothetical protein
MLYDSKMMKSFPQSLALKVAPSLQAAPDAPGPAPRVARWLRVARSPLAARGADAAAVGSAC